MKIQEWSCASNIHLDTFARRSLLVVSLCDKELLVCFFCQIMRERELRQQHEREEREIKQKELYAKAGGHQLEVQRAQQEEKIERTLQRQQAEYKEKMIELAAKLRKEKQDASMRLRKQLQEQVCCVARLVLSHVISNRTPHSQECHVLDLANLRYLYFATYADSGNSVCNSLRWLHIFLSASVQGIQQIPI